MNIIYWLGVGGPLLWIIAACGVGALAVYLERALHLRRAAINHRDFLQGVRNVLDKGNADEAVQICEEAPGPVPALGRAAILHRHEPRHVLAEAIGNVGRAEIARMERRVAVIATIGQIAPLLGLLGTIFGFIETVVALRDQTPLIYAASVTDGVLRALVNAAAGLLVAAPCYVMHHSLLLQIDRMALDMEAAEIEITAYLTARQGAEKKHA
jgi:biopolymer transport protein ExbB